MKELTLTVLYPDIFNLHGDRGNAWAFQRVGGFAGADVKLVKVAKFADELPLDDTDILLCSSCELTVAARVADALRSRRKELEKYIDDGGTLVCTGGSAEVFGKTTRRHDGSSFEGLGLVDLTFSELRACYSNDAVMETEQFGGKMEIVGGQLQMAKVFVGEGTEALGRAVYGYGNHKSEDEGAVFKNALFTNYLGPVFVKNPWFAEAVLRRAAARRGIELEPVPDDMYALERRSNEQIKRFIDLKIEKYDKTRLNNEE